MRRILAALSASSLLLGSACDRNDPTIPTTTERPPRFSYAYARIEGSITIKEDPYSGDILVTCSTATIAGHARAGTYSMLLRFEIASVMSESCRIDVGQPIQATRSFELPITIRIDSLPVTKVDVVVLPDLPPRARMELPIKSLSAAGAHTCAISATGATYC